jgi:hypothetical protein
MLPERRSKAKCRTASAMSCGRIEIQRVALAVVLVEVLGERT